MWMYQENIFTDALHAYYAFCEFYVSEIDAVVTGLTTLFLNSPLGFLADISIDEDFMYKLSVSTYSMTALVHYPELVQ